jgi:hypothetical protein
MRAISAASVPSAKHFIRQALFRGHADIEMNPKFSKKMICD